MSPAAPGKSWAAEIAAGLKAQGIEAPSGAAEALDAYLGLLAEWNRAYNLTAVRDPGEMVQRHILDSAAALPFLQGTHMLDAGSGAGLPGLVLAVLAPRTSWVLAESTGKKARFLAHAVRSLALGERVSVHAGRVEDYPAGAGFDTVTARALADLPQLAKWLAPLLAPDGRIVALKGRLETAREECTALGGGWRSRINPVNLPGQEAERCIVVLERESTG